MYSFYLRICVAPAERCLCALISDATDRARTVSMQPRNLAVGCVDAQVLSQCDGHADELLSFAR